MEEKWIAIAILRLVELEKCVVEGAGAAGLAAILAGHLDELKGKRSVVLKLQQTHRVIIHTQRMIHDEVMGCRLNIQDMRFSWWKV